MIDCIATPLVFEPAIVADGPDFTIVLPEHLAETAEAIAKLVSGIQTVGRTGVADVTEGAA